jgi:hypothetical protein
VSLAEQKAKHMLRMLNVSDRSGTFRKKHGNRVLLKIGIFRQYAAIISGFAKTTAIPYQERWMSGLSRTPGKRV